MAEAQPYLSRSDLNLGQPLLDKALEDGGAVAAIHINPLTVQVELVGVRVVQVLADGEVATPASEPERVAEQCLNSRQPQDVVGVGTVTSELPTDSQPASTEAAADDDTPLLVFADRRARGVSVHVVKEQPR